MKRLKTIGAICCTFVFGLLVLIPSARGDDWNKKTVLTIDQPLKVPGATLPPGKYVFKLLDSSTNRHVVQVFNEDETKLYSTILAIPNYRLEPTGDSKFSFWETPKGSPPALRSWFYPGDNFGQEFAYPKNEATQLASFVKENVPSVSEAEQAEVSRAPAKSEQTAPASSESNAEPAAQGNGGPSESTPAATQSGQEASSQPTEQPKTLPKTASPFPLVGLIGLLSLGAALAIRVIRQHIA